MGYFRGLRYFLSCDRKGPEKIESETHFSKKEKTHAQKCVKMTKTIFGKVWKVLRNMSAMTSANRLHNNLRTCSEFSLFVIFMHLCAFLFVEKLVSDSIFSSLFPSYDEKLPRTTDKSPFNSNSNNLSLYTLCKNGGC